MSLSQSPSISPHTDRLVLPVIDQLSGVKIEGGGVAVNSAGLPLDLVDMDNQRRRRDTRDTNSSLGKTLATTRT